MNQPNSGGILETIAFTTACSHLSVSVNHDDRSEQVTYGTGSQSNLVLRCVDNKNFIISTHETHLHQTQQLHNHAQTDLSDFDVSIAEIVKRAIGLPPEGNCLFQCFSIFVFGTDI